MTPAIPGSGETMVILSGSGDKLSLRAALIERLGPAADPTS